MTNFSMATTRLNLTYMQFILAVHNLISQLYNSIWLQQLNTTVGDCIPQFGPNNFYYENSKLKFDTIGFDFHIFIS